MTMTFYLGKEYHTYEKKFKNIKDYIRRTEDLKRNSRAETFRWILDAMDKHINELRSNE